MKRSHLVVATATLVLLTAVSFTVRGADAAVGEWTIPDIPTAPSVPSVETNFTHDGEVSPSNQESVESPAVSSSSSDHGSGPVVPHIGSMGTITVTKIVSGGTLPASSFQLYLDGMPITSGVATTTTMGVHIVSEGEYINYDSQFSGDCHGHNNHVFVTVFASSSVNCTLTNTFKDSSSTTTASTTSTVTVVKTVVNDNGGTATSSNFTLSIFNGSGTTTFKGSATGTVFVLNASTTYAVTESATSSYSASFSSDCSGTVGAGENRVCTVTNNDIGTSSTSTPPPSGSGGGGGSGGGTGGQFTGGGGGPTGGGGSSNLGQVLGAATDTASCGLYINTYMRQSNQNDVMEVARLQLFLNQHLGLRVPVSGFFGPMTEAAVNQFQVRYGEEVLGPWVRAGLHSSILLPTGYVYKTTQRWVNLLNCPSLNLPVPPLP